MNTGAITVLLLPPAAITPVHRARDANWRSVAEAAVLILLHEVLNENHVQHNMNDWALIPEATIGKSIDVN